MAERIRYHLDEPVDPVIARALRKHGIDVTTTQEAGLRTRPDTDQLEFARSERRVIITRDVDFLRIAAGTADHPGFAYWRQGSEGLGAVIERLILIYEVLTADEIAGRVEFL